MGEGTATSVRPGGDRPPLREAPLRVALLGCGAVGSQVFRLLGEQAPDLAARVGASLQVAGVAVRDPGGRARAAGVPEQLITADAMGLVTRPDVDVVVEMIGGIEPARSLLLADPSELSGTFIETPFTITLICPGVSPDTA